MSSKKSGFGCLPILGVVVALSLGGRYLSRQFLGKQLTPVDAAKVIPNQVIMAGFVATDAKKWSQIQELGNSQNQKIFEAQVEDLKAELPAESANFNYQQDIQPWLGGAMFALVPESTGISNSNLLIVLGIKNKLKARNFLKKLQAESQAELQQSKYKGVQITESTNQQDETTISALLGNRLLLAEDREVIEQAIDAYKGEPSLASMAQNKQMLKQKLNTGNALAQIYIPNYGKLITQAIAANNKTSSIPLNLSALQSIESTVIGFGAEKQGLRLRSVTKFDADAIESNFVANKNRLLKRFPNSTVALISGQGIDQVWTQVIAQLKQDNESSKFLNLAKLSLRQSANLNLEQDIFNWMDGEFALGMITTPQSIAPQLDVGLSGGIIIETSQPEKAKQTLAQLENSLQRNLAITPNQNKINNKTVTQLRAPNTKSVLNYGWLDKNNLLFAWGDYAFESISESQKSPLAKSKSFKAMAKQLPEQNAGYFYVDVAQIMMIVNQLPLPESNPETKNAIALLNSVQGIGSTVTMPDKSTSQQDVFILFKDN